MTGDVEHRDLAGRPIVVGDFVVYAAQRGNCPTLKFGRVSRLEERTGALVSTGERKSFPSLRLVTVTQCWRNGWRTQRSEGEVTVNRLDRVMVVSQDHVPSRVLELLLKREDYVPFG